MEKTLDNDPNIIDTIIASLIQYSMRCRCGGLAPPKCSKGRDYQCLICNKTYEGINYNFMRFQPIFMNNENILQHDMRQTESFQEAISKLREKYNLKKKESPVYSKTLKKLWSKVKY